MSDFILIIPPPFYTSVSIHVQCKYILSLSDACNCFSRWSSLLFDIWSAKQIVGDLCMAFFYIWATKQTKRLYQISTSDYGRCTGRTRDSSLHSLERSMTYIYLCWHKGLKIDKKCIILIFNAKSVKVHEVKSWEQSNKVTAGSVCSF